ncbi:MAG: hypothetical protein ACJASL_001913 [Paraglaciecola sp.]|jgi:hypothetical protein
MSLNKNDFHCSTPSTLKEIIVVDKISMFEKSLLLSVVKAANPNTVVKTARLKKLNLPIRNSLMKIYAK